MNGILSDRLERAIQKKAIGHTYTEVTEEYAVSDGEQTLVRRKVKKTQVPPDITALKLLLELDSSDVSSWTEEEVRREKQRLIGLLKEAEKNGVESCNG